MRGPIFLIPRADSRDLPEVRQDCESDKDLSARGSTDWGPSRPDVKASSGAGRLKIVRGGPLKKGLRRRIMDFAQLFITYSRNDNKIQYKTVSPLFYRISLVVPYMLR